MSQVGSAFSTYELRIERFRQNAKEVVDTYRSLNEAAARFSERTVSAPAPRVPSTTRNADAGRAAQEAATEAAIVRRATAEARLAQTSGDAAKAEQILRNALSLVNKDGDAGVRIQTQLAQAHQKLARESERAVQAQQRMATEQQRTAAAASRAELAALRLAQAQAKASQGPSSTSNWSKSLDTTAQSGSEVIEVLGGIATKAGVAGAALAIVGKGVELAQVGAQADLVERRFNSLAETAGTTGKEILAALRSASGGEITDLNLQLAANRAIMLGVADSAEEFSTLMAIARDRAQSLGISTTQAFNDLVTGLGRGSAEILDNLGIMISAEEVTKNYAASLGKSATELTAAERKQAVLNAVLSQGQATLAATGGAADTNAGKMASIGVAAGNATTSVGKFLSTLASPFLEISARGLQAVADGMEEINQKGVPAAERFQDAFADTSNFDAYNAKLQQIRQTTGSIDLNPLSREQYDYAKALQATGVASDEAQQRGYAYAAIQRDLANATGAVTAQNAEVAARYQALVPAMAAAAAASDENNAAVYRMVDGFFNGTVAIGELETKIYTMSSATTENIALNMANADSLAVSTVATVDHAAAAQASADASLIDASAKELQALQTQALQAQTQLAAAEMMALYPNIDAAGVASLVAAGKISAATGELINNALAAAKARAEIAALNAQAGVAAGRAADIKVFGGKNVPRGKAADIADAADRSLNSPRAIAQANARIAQSKAQAQAEKDLAEAKDQQIIATGTAAQKQALYNQKLAEAKRIYGENSAEYVRAKTQLDSFTQSQAKAAAGAGKGAKAAKAAGATKLSDQEKLNNKLLDSQESFQEKFEDAELKHAQKLLKIEQDYAEKSLRQQRKNETDKRRSRFDFYKNLSDASKDLDPSQVAGLAAAYEADFAKAQEMARNGQAKLSQDYLALKKAQRQEDLQYEQDVAEARKAIKEAESADERRQAEADLQRLQELRKLQLDAQREEEKQLLEDGDDIQNERQKQITDENREYEEQIGAIADKSDAASQRILTNYQRQKKAIDDNTLALIQQGEAQDRLGNPSAADTRVSAPPSASAATTATSPAPTNAVASNDKSIVAVADAAAQATLTTIQSGLDALRGQIDALIGVGREDITQGRNIERAVSNLKGNFAN